MANDKLCSKCSKSALYHDKLEQLYCEKCYWEKDEDTKRQAKNRSWKTYTGRDIVENTTYLKCPHCFLGDSCGTDGCITQICGLYHPEGSKNCSVCKIESEKVREERERTQNKEKFDQQKAEIDNYSSEITILEQVQSLDIEDYKKIKQLKNKLLGVNNKLANESFREEVNSLQAKLAELEKKFPEQTRIKENWRVKNAKQGIESHCFHQNIYWKDFFQKEKNNDAYCLECGEDKSAGFAKKFQRWYCKKIEEWLREHNLKKHQFLSFLKKNKNNSDGLWWQLKKGKFEEDFDIGQSIIWELCENIEECCLEFAQEKGVKVNNDNSIRERERERAKIQSEIDKLKNKASRTVEEDQELTDKEKELEDLDKKAKNNSSSPTSYLPWIISGGCLLTFLFLIAFITTRKKRK